MPRTPFEAPLLDAIGAKTLLYGSSGAQRQRWLCWAALSLALGASAWRHVSSQHFALFWDDALFFQRVAYNLLQHGFAGWNQQEGPVFVGTSQLFQLLAVGLSGLFPGYYSAAVTFWGALALSLCFPLLAAAARPGPLGCWLLVCLLCAPPVLLSVESGMETPSVLLGLSLFLWRLCKHRQRPQSWELIALQPLVYALRPDAVLLTGGSVLVLLLAEQRFAGALRFLAGSALGIGLELLAFRLYYGTAFPLSTFLKLSAFSIYDAEYLSMDRTNKLKNLAQMGLLLLPLTPLFGRVRDRLTLALCGAGSLFIAFHAFGTYEIAAYHARFYAPALPFFFVAALRGVAPAASAQQGRAQQGRTQQGRTQQRALLWFGLLACALLLVLYFPNGIENQRRVQASQVSLYEYARYFAGVPLLGLLLLLLDRWAQGDRARHARELCASGALALGACTLHVLCALPECGWIVSDAVSHAKTAESHGADVGIDVIQRCFAPPFQLAHSEIGLPGVMFPEARVIDFTGLANRAIIERRFDLEELCRRDRPEFVFRPHSSHRALNSAIDASRCFAENYRAVPLPRKSSCPLLVRQDLVERYLACAAGH